MSVEWVAGLLVVVAIACLGGTAFLFFRESWLIQWLRGTAGLLLAALAFYLALVAASLFTYQAVSASQPLATVSFENAGPQTWQVTIAEANGDRRSYEVLGDLWQLDVRLLRYSGIGAIFGTSPSFQLERVAGRYLSVEDESSKDHSDYLLAPQPFLGFDLWQRAADRGSLIVEATRSNVALVPMAEGAIFEVTLGEEDVLSLRAANSAAEQALKSLGE